MDDRQREKWRVPLRLGPRPFEEDEIGYLEIDRERLRLALVNTLTDFTATDDVPPPVESAATKIAEYLKHRLAGDLALWLRAYVTWELRLGQMTPDEFLDFLRAEPWDPELLAVPAVQDKIEIVRSTKMGSDRKRLGQWIQGTIRPGRPADRSPEHMRFAFRVTKKHLTHLVDGLRGTDNPRTAFAAVRGQFASIADRLEEAGLVNDFLEELAARQESPRGAYPRRGRWWQTLPGRVAFIDGFAAQLLAEEHRSTASSIYKLGARSSPATRKPSD